jgi:NADPH:quinone reductase-like Zn-dependent oxidoreductase
MDEAFPGVTLTLPTLGELNMDWEEFMMLHLAAVTIYQRVMSDQLEEPDGEDFLILAD